MLKKALDNLSNNLNVLYDDALLRTESQSEEDHRLAMKAIRWVAYTFRPLSADILRVALAIEPDATGYDYEAIPAISLILDVCAGLLILDEENEVVRLVHYTAQDYFDSYSQSSFNKARASIAGECIMYLGYDCFQQQWSRRWPSSYRMLGIKGLKRSSRSRPDVSELYEYASCFWAQHVTAKRDYDLNVQVREFLARSPRITLRNPSQYRTDFYGTHHGRASHPLDKHHGCEIAAFFGLHDELERFL